MSAEAEREHSGPMPMPMPMLMPVAADGLVRLTLRRQTTRMKRLLTSPERR
jgi:hypothetical protein